MPKISVIIPNYNHAGYLRRRIESVINQTFTDFELIYLDDASSDNSNEIIAEYTSDPRIRTIFNPKNSGNVFKQWNRGFREAKGEYIWVAESDDFADSAFLETLAAILDHNQSIGVVYCQSRVVDESDVESFIVEEEWFGSYIDTLHWRQDFISKGQEEIARYFSISCIIPNISCALLRRSVIEEIGYCDESFFLAGDWRFWIKMLKVSDIAYCARPFNFWRRHSATVTSKAHRSGAFIEESYRIIASIAAEFNVPKESLEKALKLRCSQWIIYSPLMKFGLAKNISIYRIAKGIDRNLGKRLVPALLYRVARCVISPVRRWLRGASE